MIPWLAPGDPGFPPVEWALDEPNGLLAAGGELTPEWLIEAYPRGIFPWFSEGDPILWWAPHPRCVILTDRFHCSKSLKKRMRKLEHQVHVDRNFTGVMRACAAPRPDQDETWISNDFIRAYSNLAHQGVAHSVELYVSDELVGGLYGLMIGRLFFGESMFSKVPDGSKICLYYLCERLRSAGVKVIDCQISNPHLLSLGAQEMERSHFEHALLDCKQAPKQNIWTAGRWI